VHRVLVGKPEGKRTLGRPRRRWEDNIKRHLEAAGCGVMHWIELVQGRDRWRAFVNAVMNIRFP
jgi:ribosome biogenesis protein Nip4